MADELWLVFSSTKWSVILAFEGCFTPYFFLCGIFFSQKKKKTKNEIRHMKFMKFMKFMKSRRSLDPRKRMSTWMSSTIICGKWTFLVVSSLNGQWVLISLGSQNRNTPWKGCSRAKLQQLFLKLLQMERMIKAAMRAADTAGAMWEPDQHPQMLVQRGHEGRRRLRRQSTCEQGYRRSKAMFAVQFTLFVSNCFDVMQQLVFWGP